MIITCEECSTRFDLDESMIKAGGSKVRCSLCKHIFTVFPQVPEPPMAPEPEEELSFDLPEEAPDDLETFELETDMEADDSELDFQETSFEIDDLNFETNDIGLEMEAPEKDATDIEINFDPESYDNETDVNIEFEEDELTFEDTDIEFDDPDEVMPPPKDLEAPDAFDSYEYTSLDQDTLTLEEDELEADLSFDDDPDADLVFEETGSEQDLALLELEPSDDQHMTFPDLAMETKDPETSPKEAELTLDLEEDPFEPLDNGLGGLDLAEGPEPSSETHEENIEPEDAFSSYDQVLDQDTEPEGSFQDPDDITPYAITDDITGGEPIEKDETLPGSPLRATQTEQEETSDHPELHPGRPRKRKKRSGMGGPVMLLILLFILVAGAYIASMTLGYKIPYLSDVKIPILEKYFNKEMPQKAALKPIPNEGSVNGRFISNDTAGELFIITGQIENPSTIPYSYLQVMGTLITKGKVKAKTLTTFCGNIISEETLKTGNILDITKQLTTREGAHNSNVNVKPGGFVPFMIVFSDLPDNLENFTVEVVEL
jgi:predicted Zn finger-like uncharacterized protein